MAGATLDSGMDDFELGAAFAARRDAEDLFKTIDCEPCH
jgi:hypothetical protein